MAFTRAMLAPTEEGGGAMADAPIENGPDEVRHLVPEGSTADVVLAHLAHLVRTIDTTDASITIDVTLAIYGTPYAGTLVSGRRWAEQVAADFREKAADPDAGDAIAKVFDVVAGAYASDESHEKPLGYVHLLNASIIGPGGAPVWRPEGLPLRRVAGGNLAPRLSQNRT